MRKLILLAVISWAVPGFAQFTAQRIIRGAALPARCAVGDVFYKTAAPAGQYTCAAVNTWLVAGNWLKYNVVKIANGVGGCTTAKGCWAVNSGVAVAAAAATTQVLTWLAAPANAELERVRIKTAVACAGITAITISALGTTASASEFYTGGTFNLKTAVSDTQLLWPAITTPNLTAAATNWTITVSAGSDSVDDITAGCAFDLLAKWAVMP